MMFGAHWGYWLALGLAVAGLIGEQVRQLVSRRRFWRYAFEEQQRREDVHYLPYREDQRVRAVQQRLSRRWGPKAFSPSLKKKIEEELRGMADQQRE